MFKRRLSKSRRHGNNSSSRSVSSQQRSVNDASSENSSEYGGGSRSSGVESTLKPIIKKTSEHQYSITGSTQDTTRSQNDESAPEHHIKIKRSRSVVFGEVHIREFERILGDNPSCSSGAPIAIGWGFGNERILAVDHYEDSKKGSRRPQMSLVLTRQAREELLLEWGTSFHDIIDSIRTNVKIKNQRRRTVNAIGTYDRWEEVMETASRKIKRTLLLKKSKKDDIAPSLPKKTTKKGDEIKDDGDRTTQRHNTKRIVREVGAMECENTLMESCHSRTVESVRSRGSGSSSKKSGRSPLGRFSAHSAGNRFEKNSGSPLERHPRDAYIAPISEVIVSHPQQNLGYVNTGFSVMPCVVPDEGEVGDAVSEIGGFGDGDFDDIEEDVTIASRDFVPENDTSQYEAAPIDTMKYLRAMDDPRFLEAMDDPGAFYNFDEMSACTPISEFSYPNLNDDEEEEDAYNDDEFEDLDRDNSYWEVRSSGQDCPAIRRKENPVVISEDGDDNFVLESQWADHRFVDATNQPNIVST